MRHLSLLAALVLAVAGCSSPSQDEGGNEPDAPEPTSVSEDVDLIQGMTDTWSMTVYPNSTAAEVSFVLAPAMGVAGSAAPPCIEWARPSGKGTAGACGDATASVSPTLGPNGRTLLHWQGGEVTPGYYSFQVSADPQVATLQVRLTATY